MSSRSLVSTLVLALALLASACSAKKVGAVLREELPEIELVGAKALGRGALETLVLRELGEVLGEVRPRVAADDAAFLLAEHYRSQGFPDVAVTYEWSEPGAEHARGLVRFTIVEGPRALIERLEFRGNASVPSAQLRNLYDGPRVGTLGTGPLVYDAARARGFAERLERVFLDRGHLSVAVEPPAVSWNADRTRVVLAYAIDEGPLHRLTEVRFEGDLPNGEAPLRALAAPRVGAAYVPSVALDLRGALLEHFGEAGYPSADVRVKQTTPDAPENHVLTFTLHLGTRTRVREIEVRGAERTRVSTVRRLVALRVGDWYRLSLERRSFQALYGSGLFKSVHLSLIEAAGDEATLLVEVEESPSSEVFVEPGYGSYEKARLRAGVRDGNLFGLGHTGRAEATLGFVAQQVELGYTDPALLGSVLELDLSTYWTRREEPSFLRREAGVGATLTRRFDAARRLALGYRFRNSKADDVEVLDAETLAALDTVNVSSVTLTPTYDTRDGVFAPSDGSLARVILEYAGTALGSEIEFVRVRAQFATFHSLREGTVLAGALRTGVIAPVGETREIPIQERFFNGGEVTVRSFRQDELGLRDAQGAPIGGEGFTVLNAELRQHLFGALHAAAFADTGNVTGDAADYLDFAGFRHALGVGVRYLLPIGPVRLDWGWNPNPQNIEETWVLHLSVGMAF